MSVTFVEDNLLFEFGDRWTMIVKWDRERAHLEGMANDKLGHVHEGKDVDFVGFLEGKVLFFIEVKDHRYHHRDSARGQLGEEFELKVRSTVAALVGGYRNGFSECESLFEALTDPRRIIRLVIWEEKLHESARSEASLDKQRRARDAIDTSRSRRDVPWLCVDTIRVSSFDHYDMVPDLRVTPLPRERKEKVEQLIRMFDRRGHPIDKKAAWKIRQTCDLDRLEQWLEQAPSVSSPWKLRGMR